MEYSIFQIDTFTDQLFAGNPACVVPLDEWLPDDLLLKIAQENAVAETAFFVRKGENYHLRWFTPDIEMDLCGHATLATAYVLKYLYHDKKEKLIFETLSGNLFVEIKNDIIYINLPSRMPVEATLPENIAKSLNIQPQKVFKSRDYVLVYHSEEEIKQIKVNQPIFDLINLDPGGVVVTAIGTNDCDFVSRYFTPQSTILEDPVTGSSHCSLIPFWSNTLHKQKFIAKQLSERGGVLYCELKKDRVIIGGKAKTYFQGALMID